MARTRTLLEMRGDAYQRADLVGAEDRHPPAQVDRYLNQGGTEAWDLLIEARGREYHQVDPPQEIVTAADTTVYDLPEDFYLLISVRLKGTHGRPLEPYDSQEEAHLSYVNDGTRWPRFYQLRRAPGGANTLVLLPSHAAGHIIVVEYVPVFADLQDDADEYDGINGWEDYPVNYAAREMLKKDGETADAADCQADMDRLAARIKKLAPKRDMHRARRVKDVRGPQRSHMVGPFGRWR